MNEAKPHGADCQCTYCIPMAEIAKMCPELCDGLGKIHPDVHRFAGQSADNVKKLLKAAETPPKPVRLEPAGRGRNFLVGDFLEDEQPVLERDHVRAVECPITTETRQTWQKLSGVRPDQQVFADDLVGVLVEAIEEQAARRLPNVPVGWTDACTFQSLKVGDVPTNIHLDQVLHVYKALTGISGEAEAADTVARLVVGKLEKLFV